MRKAEMDKSPIKISLAIDCPDLAQPREVSLTLNGIPLQGAGNIQPLPDAQSHKPGTQAVSGSLWQTFRCDSKAYGLLQRLAVFALLMIPALLIVQFLLYRQFFMSTPGFLQRYGWWLLYLDISVVAVFAVLAYLRTYHLRTSHMMSMMIGMVVGMQSGTMLGSVMGATNGLFVGSMVGMLSGGVFGIYIGCRCASTMAVVQGLMSGGMAGTMGAMLIAMMLRDHVLVFMPFFTLVNLLILIGFTFLFHEHSVITGECPARNTPPSFPLLILYTFLTTTFLAWLMLYGPKSAMVWTGEPPASMMMGHGQNQDMNMDMGGMDMGTMK